MALSSKSEIIYISTADSLTKIDGNSSETYDSLVDMRREVAAENTETNASISTYNLMLEDLALDQAQNVVEGVVSEIAETSETDAESSKIETAEIGISEIEEQIETLFDTSKEEKRAIFEADISALEGKYEDIVAEFSEMMQAWNKSKLNESSVSYSKLKYQTPKLLSGAFIKQGILTTGPIFALALIICLIYIIHTKKREEKI